MNNLRALLQDADPLRHEAPLADTERERVRARVLSSITRDPVSMLNRARVGLLAVVGVGMLVAAAVSRMGWIPGATPVHAAVRFEVRLAEETPVAGLVVAQIPGSSRVIYMHPEIIVSNDDIAESSVLQAGPERFSIAVRFLSPGAARMRQATSAHVGRPLAILIDGSVVAAPVVRAPISDQALVSGDYTRADAERIADGMKLR
jgi:hypothetical protein